jgi:hypothetical protein
MQMIDGPETLLSSFEYDLECEIALEDEFGELVEHFELEGWPRDTVAEAMYFLALEHVEVLKVGLTTKPGSQ